MFLDGLAFKTWRMVEGEWFEGTYVFDQRVYRDDFQVLYLRGDGSGSCFVLLGR